MFDDRDCGVCQSSKTGQGLKGPLFDKRFGITKARHQDRDNVLGARFEVSQLPSRVQTNERAGVIQRLDKNVAYPLAFNLGPCQSERRLNSGPRLWIAEQGAQSVFDCRAYCVIPAQQGGRLGPHSGVGILKTLGCLVTESIIPWNQLTEPPQRFESYFTLIIQQRFPKSRDWIHAHFAKAREHHEAAMLAGFP
jgi:hypothetical protein